MYQRILSYFLWFLLDDEGFGACDGDGPNKLLWGSPFDGDLWLKRLTAVCGEIVGIKEGWFCMNEGTLLMASNLADWAALMKPPVCCGWFPNNPPLGACDGAFPNNPLVCPAGLKEPVLNNPLAPPVVVGPLRNEALFPGNTLPVWLLNDALRKLPFKLFVGRTPGVIFDSDYSHIDESKLEYWEVLWTGDWNDEGLTVGGWRCGEFDVNGVEEIVDLNTLASSFLLLINYCNNVTFGVLTGAKNGLCFVP